MRSDGKGLVMRRAVISICTITLFMCHAVSAAPKGVKLFCFASRNLDNIWLGVKHQKWAVATVGHTARRCRETKARRYLIPGVHGLLYCNPLHAFMVPFVVTSI